ncbi:MAG: phosphate signaling complex protein PhoU [Chitinispirillia bacterium]|jgi:phosphate transport system protein
MARLLEKEIEMLKKKIFELCAMIEENCNSALKCIENKDTVLAEKVIKNDDEIDNMEIEVEEECLKILALHQPVAIDLRYIIAALKINNDLERIGDLAVNIAKHMIKLSELEEIEIEFDFQEMMDKSMAMVKKSIDAFVYLDSSLCYEVIVADDELDTLNENMFSLFKEYAKKQPDHIDSLLRFLSISRCLERIGDHATNIAEDVIYMTDGNIVRHRTFSQDISLE